ncbi:hypothetical protein Tco_0290911 [Tanacetum coccineum]
MPLTPDLSFTSLDEFVNKHVVENGKAMPSEEEPKIVKKNDDAPIIEEWVSDDEEEDVDCNYHQKQFQNQRMVKPVWNNAQRPNHQNFAKKTHPCAKKNLVLRAVLMKAGLISVNTARQGNPQMDLQNQGMIDSGCSRHMIGNMSYLTDHEETDGGYVTFRGNPKGGKITRKVFGKLPAINGFDVPLPVAVCSGIANSLL